MNFKWDWRPTIGGGVPFFLNRTAQAHNRALQTVAARARQRAPRRSGEYAGSIMAHEELDFLRSSFRGSVGSNLPQARTVERGANVGARRGPHMRGQPTIRPAVLSDFGREFANEMRSG